MSDAIVIEEAAGGGAEGARVVELSMTAHDRRRVRRVIEAPDGTKLALALATGTVLTPGQVLYRANGCAYVVTAASEDVIVARPRTIDEAARVGHVIGNLHRDLDASAGEVVALADTALANRLRRVGVPFSVERRAFQGRAPGEHAH